MQDFGNFLLHPLLEGSPFPGPMRDFRFVRRVQVDSANKRVLFRGTSRGKSFDFALLQPAGERAVVEPLQGQRSAARVGC